VDYRYKKKFWQNTENKEKYKSISDFNCFDDRIIAKDDLIKEFKPHYNIEKWIAYYRELFDIFFADYKLELSIPSKKIKYKRIANKDVFLGIVCDYSGLKRELKRGEIDLPAYDIILFTLNDKNKIEQEIRLGELKHPLFDPPCIPMTVFFPVKTVHRKSSNEFLVSRGIEKIYLGKDKYLIQGQPELGKELKENAFFYYDLWSTVSKILLKYIEEAMENATEDELK